jgi:uncharacterized protein YyaL (SSP411 family)
MWLSWLPDPDLPAGPQPAPHRALCSIPPPLGRPGARSTRVSSCWTGSGTAIWADETFGGGFWWNTGRGDSPEGKPAQANALAALLFGRLYLATGAEEYRTWALRTLDWLDGRLFDPGVQLYRWSMAFQDFTRRDGSRRSDRLFNYDQAIAIEAQLVGSMLDGDQTRVEHAREVGGALHATFWNLPRGGYNLEAGVEQVFTSYSAWTSLGHLALYDLDGDATWLALAQQNATAMVEALGEADGGFAYQHSASAHGVSVDRTRDTSAQAWMQHLLAKLAWRL